MQDKKQIVQAFFKKRNLLTPEALDFVSSDQSLCEKKFDTLIIDRDTLIDNAEAFAVLKNLTEKPKELKKEDFVNFYTSKFEKMKNIIVSRLQKDFVSLNKIGSLKNEVYAIGIVREKRQNGKVLEIEDMSDSKEIVFDSEQDVEIDDVIAVKAVTGTDTIFGKNVLYPDVPLRQPTKGFGKGCFFSDLHLDETPKKEAEKLFSWLRSSNIKNVFVAGDIGDTKFFEELVEEYCSNKRFFCIPGHTEDDMDYPTLPEKFSRKNITALSNPATLSINGLTILIIHNCDMSHIKKRYLGKSKLILKEDYLVLDDVPDIVHCGHTHRPETSNYKSISIVNSGSLLAEFKPVVIDFETREVSQISL